MECDQRVQVDHDLHQEYHGCPATYRTSMIFRLAMRDSPFNRTR